MFYAPLGKWDRDSQSWRTSEATSLWALTLSSLTLPTWGGLHDGELCEHPTPALATSVLDSSSLPTPTAGDSVGTGYAESWEELTQANGRHRLRDAANLLATLPTPTTDDAGNITRESGAFQSLTRSVQMLPTPAVNDMGEGKTLEWWDDWAPRQKSSDGRPAPHGRSLAIEALRTLPTPREQHGEPRNQNIYARPADQPQNLENALHGVITAPPSPDGNTSSDDPHQHQLSLDELGIPA
jgi:hypothetical protein